MKYIVSIRLHGSIVHRVLEASDFDGARRMAGMLVGLENVVGVVEKPSQSQAALIDQLHELVTLATHRGLYDAADFIRRVMHL